MTWNLCCTLLSSYTQPIFHGGGPRYQKLQIMTSSRKKGGFGPPKTPPFRSSSPTFGIGGEVLPSIPHECIYKRHTLNQL
ncbi:hypothetical protein BDM02DRAFT_2310720 [Thelephora ganbajun]|uniref:Uncharacterized protein n=1 Tax=Thelephora ganbajun TaxID=370292 RepID=A0ACB6YY87_THEGA|nr:hypothetical protein BDM02DRAFT_2310720 [Thelephora ganbajun]